jgi:hypothetical protein
MRVPPECDFGGKLEVGMGFVEGDENGRPGLSEVIKLLFVLISSSHSLENQLANRHHSTMRNCIMQFLEYAKSRFVV